MPMTLEQLRIFAAVASREHVTRAARDLNLTQSAVSAAVAALEARHATKLFDRIGRRIELTEAGRLFLAEARAVLARAAAAETVLADLAGLKRGSLSLAASQTIANYWLPPLLHRYRAACPGIGIGLAIGNSETVASMVRQGSVDLGFIEGEIDDPSLAVEPVAEDEIVVVASPATGPWAAGPRAAADPKSFLKSLRWVFREQGSGTRAIFEAALARLGLTASDLDIVLELPSNEAVRSAVEDGAGAAALSRLAVAASLRSGLLAALDLPCPRRRFFALRHRERHASAAEKELYRFMEASMKREHP
jgi:DNA-binding transcriptional LysR family regulator